jgi:hypothetical protein
MISESPFSRMRKALDHPLFVPLILLLFCALLYGFALIHYNIAIISEKHNDLSSEFYYWREFGFSELRKGHIAQWNPFVYGGVPFFGGWQSSLFYPPNWIYLFLPLNLALTLDIAISTYLAGLFSSLLARRYGFHPLSQLLVGSIVMMGGAFFPHGWAGHQATMAAMAWTPLLIYAADWAIDKPGVRPVLLGAFAGAMQVFAGHPQTVYYASIIIGAYCIIRLVKAENRGKAIACLAAIGLFAGLLSAIQLLTGIEINQEGTRNDKLPYVFASIIGFPAEKFISLLVPRFFGNNLDMLYWGRWQDWETNLFMSVAALPLLALGAIQSNQSRKNLWITMTVISLILAMGVYTPLYHPLYDYFPGYAKFRAQAKFIGEAQIFMALLAGAGLDAALRAQPDSLRRRFNQLAIGMSIMGAAVVMIALLLSNDQTGASLILWGARLPGSNILHISPNSSGWIRNAQNYSAIESLIGGCIAFLTAILLYKIGHSKRWISALFALSCIELLCYAHANVALYNPAESRPKFIENWFDAHPGDFRILQLAAFANSSMTYGRYDLWGYDPMVTKRYAEFIYATQSFNPSVAQMDVQFTHTASGFDLFRCAYVFKKVNNKVQVTKIGNPLPHALVVPHWEIMNGRDNILISMLFKPFDLRKQVILESDPGIPQSVGLSTGNSSAQAVWKDSDTLEVTADCSAPSIILITDAYSKFFTPIALPDSTQKTYSIMPTDWAAMGAPVQVGHHHFLLRYIPPMFAIGAKLSIIGWILFGAMLIVNFARRRNQKASN